jgi:hypothetical protein
MPFGLELKSLIVGALLALFVWPWLASFIAGKRSSAATTA